MALYNTMSVLNIRNLMVNACGGMWHFHKVASNDILLGADGGDGDETVQILNTFPNH